MPSAFSITVALAIIVLLIALVFWLRRGPGGTVMLGAAWRFTRLWTRIVHRPTYVNWAQVPDKKTLSAPGLIIVSNHTGAVDPFLIQARCGFTIRWMMATDMMYQSLNRFWSELGVIPVRRDGRDSIAVREALRGLQRGEVVGIFPEGGIVTPPREVRPFQTGIGMLIKRSKAPVALLWISGTPDTNETLPSLTTSCRARIECLGIFDFSDHRDSAAIVQTLREAIARRSGWPINDEVLKPAHLTNQHD